MSHSKKKKGIPIFIKKAIIDLKNKNKQIMNKEIVIFILKTYKRKIHPSTVSKIIKNKNKYEKYPTLSATRLSNINNARILSELYNWIIENQTSDLIITDAIIIKKADIIAKKWDFIILS